MNVSRHALVLVLAVLGAAGVAAGSRFLWSGGERRSAALAERLEAAAEAAGLADRVIALERLRGELLAAVSSGGPPADMGAWIRSRLPEGTPEEALVAVGIEELPGAQILAETYRLSLSEIPLQDALRLLCELRRTSPPVAVGSVDLTPGTAGGRFGLALEIVGYTAAAGVPGS